MSTICGGPGSDDWAGFSSRVPGYLLEHALTVCPQTRLRESIVLGS